MINEAPSVYQATMGPEFAPLQTEIQDYFALAPDSTCFGHGRGVFDIAGCPQPLLRPFFALAALDHSFLPEYGTDIPFDIFNFAHRNEDGRQTLTALRLMHFPRRTRIFLDSTVQLYNGELSDELGSSRIIRTGLVCAAGSDGRMRLASRRSSVGIGKARMTLPAFADATAFTDQWWNGQRFSIRTKVLHRVFGELFTYSGEFSYALRTYDDAVPTELGAHLGLLPVPVRQRLGQINGH